MSMHQFVKLFCLNYQAYSPTLLVGKLSKILMNEEDFDINVTIEQMQQM